MVKTILLSSSPGEQDFLMRGVQARLIVPWASVTRPQSVAMIGAVLPAEFADKSSRQATTHFRHNHASAKIPCNQ